MYDMSKFFSIETEMSLPTRRLFCNFMWRLSIHTKKYSMQLDDQSFIVILMFLCLGMFLTQIVL